MAGSVERMARTVDALEAELAGLREECKQAAAKCVLAAELAQRAEKRAASHAEAAGRRGVGDGRRVGLDNDIVTLDTPTR
jgi:hypothetical protein